MNFDEVIVSHMNWKNRLRAYVDGASTEALVAKDIARDDACALGKWIREQKVDAEVGALRAEHLRFHQAAAAVVRTCDEGKRDEARAMLGAGREYALASASVVTHIRKVQASRSKAA